MFDDLFATLSFGDTATAHGKEWQKIRQLHHNSGRDENGKIVILGNYWLAIEKGAELPAPVSIIYIENKLNPIKE